MAKKDGNNEEMFSKVAMKKKVVQVQVSTGRDGFMEN